ncbi:hypothetical protein M153_1000135968 [Pseudoloma neurophilia]|uniref:Uncharacterized protein n=1 Tax=Pseudoloma neurophilia TaxID=146866 RepID=A0A0R0M1X5_9MICR|nr:hypothetical protein M153_1000135968 [Pseudoloma neurophilia]
MRYYNEIYISIAYLFPMICTLGFCVSYFFRTPYTKISSNFPTFDDSRYFNGEKDIEKLYTYNLEEKLNKIKGGILCKVNSVPFQNISNKNLAFFVIYKKDNLKHCENIKCYSIEKIPYEYIDQYKDCEIVVFTHQTSKIVIISSMIIVPTSELISARMDGNSDLKELLFFIYAYVQIRVRIYGDFLVIYVFSEVLPYFIFKLPKQAENTAKKLIYTKTSFLKQMNNLFELYRLSKILESDIKTCKKCIDNFVLLLIFDCLRSYTVVHCNNYLVLISGHDIFVFQYFICKFPKTFRVSRNLIEMASLEYPYLERFIFTPPDDKNLEDATLQFFIDKIENQKEYTCDRHIRDTQDEKYCDFLIEMIKNFERKANAYRHIIEVLKGDVSSKIKDS